MIIYNIIRKNVINMINSYRKSVHFGIVFFLIILCQDLSAQQVLKPDKDTKQLSGQVPFDQYFYVDVEDPNGAIETFEVWQLYKVDGVIQDCKEKPEDCDKNTAKFGKRLHPSSSSEKLRMLHTNKTSRLVVPPLDPNKYFELLIINKFRGEELRKFIKDVLYTFNTTGEDEGVKVLIDLGKEIQPKAPGILRTPRTILGRYWYEEESKSDPKRDVFKPEAKKFLKTLNTAYDSAMSAANFPEVTASNLSNTAYGDAAKIYEDLDKSFTLFTEFNAIDLDTEFFQGLISPSKDEKANRHDFVKRLSYLENSQKKLKELIKALDRVRTHDAGNDAIYIAMITDAQNVLTRISASTTFLNQQIKTITDLLDDEPNMRYYTWVGGTNVITNLETISKRYIIPTIGMAYIDTEGRGPYFLKPFAGISFHLRAIDKDVPLKELSENLLHRTTIFVGFTATKLNDDTKQYSDQNDTFSMMLGMNFKLSHAIGLSAGGIALKRVDPNPTIAKKQNVISPYLALTLDVDFAKQLSKLTSKGNL